MIRFCKYRYFFCQIEKENPNSSFFSPKKDVPLRPTLGFVMTSCSKDDEPLNGGGGSESGSNYTYVSTSQSLPSDALKAYKDKFLADKDKVTEPVVSVVKDGVWQFQYTYKYIGEDAYVGGKKYYKVDVKHQCKIRKYKDGTFEFEEVETLKSTHSISEEEYNNK